MKIRLSAFADEADSAYATQLKIKEVRRADGGSGDKGVGDRIAFGEDRDRG